MMAYLIEQFLDVREALEAELLAELRRRVEDARDDR